jgi:hypothetical protein
MRSRLILRVCVVAFAFSLSLGVIRGQQAQAPAPAPAPAPRQATPAPAPAPTPQPFNTLAGFEGPQGGRGGGTSGVVGGVGPPRALPAGPTPRRADGSIIIGTVPGQKGIWLPQNGGAAVLSGLDKAPYQEWTRAMLPERQRNQLEPHTRCKPSGVARQFLTPYGAEIVEMRDIKRVFIFDIGGPHTYRTIFLDGRRHPNPLPRSYYGHSIGRWEGDTLIVDTTGYNEGFWMDRRGTPHTDQLRTVERFTRTDSRTIKYELTIDDPGAYTSPWTTTLNLVWEDGTELFEYVCQEGNYADNLMVGDQKSIDRTSAIAP